MKRLLATTAIAALMASGAAFAADEKTNQPAQAQQQQQQQQAGGQIQFVKAQGRTDWLASSLLGRAVQNQQGEALGEINNVILDEGGEVKAILIGVGGFLGIGEKLVGVPYSALQFKEREAIPPAGAADRPAGSAPPPQSGIGQSPGHPMAGGGGGQTAEREDEGHSNMVIVLNATRAQLEEAPAYVKLGEGHPVGGEQPERERTQSQ